MTQPWAMGLVLSALGCAACGWPAAQALAVERAGVVQADRVYLRTGETIEGQVIHETATDYTLLAPASASVPQRIPRLAVRFVLYGDPKKADEALGLSLARRLCRDDPEPTQVRILPTEPMGQAILEAAQRAQSSIWIAAYYLSGSRASPIRDFYEALKQKARSGLDVRVLVEYGQGTPPSIKHDSRNFVEELAQSGVQVFLLSERKPQHKKLLIVDGREVILGSSNLTLSGTYWSNEMNVSVRSPAFVRRAIEDFLEILARATPLEGSSH